MSDHLLPYLANCSLLFTEEPLLRRPAAARAAGFGAVEFWWPFATPVPSDREVDAFTTAIEEAGVALAGLNFFAGDLAGPDCGVLSIPGRSAEFRDNIDVVAGIGERLGVRGFNALYGNRVDDADPAAQDELAAESIGLAAKAVASFGGTVLIEPVSGPKPYPLRTAADAVAVVRRARAAGAANVGFLCDLYHLASNGDDIDAAIAAYAEVRRARADRRRARARRAGQRPARPGPVPGRPGRPRLPGLGKPGVQAHRDDRGEPGLAAQGAPRRGTSGGARRRSSS